MNKNNMSCPICGAEARILMSRTSEDGDSVVRRRRCAECGYTFLTEEVDGDYLARLRERAKCIHKL